MRGYVARQQRVGATPSYHARIELAEALIQLWAGGHVPTGVLTGDERAWLTTQLCSADVLSILGLPEGWLTSWLASL